MPGWWYRTVACLRHALPDRAGAAVQPCRPIALRWCIFSYQPPISAVPGWRNVPAVQIYAHIYEWAGWCGRSTLQTLHKPPWRSQRRPPRQHVEG